MRKEGLDALVVTTPANMYYLSGYDAGSEYVPQWLLVSEKKEPMWIGRFLDVGSAKGTTWLRNESIRGYSDDLLDVPGAHPVDFFVNVLKEEKLDAKRIGVELDGNYFSPLVYEKMRNSLPKATFKDTTLLVNKVRYVKSAQEIEYIRRAAKLTELGMKGGVDAAQEGVKECEVAVATYNGLTREGCGPPPDLHLITSGRRGTMAHLSFSDKKIEEGDVVTFEISSSWHRYACPMARSVVIGKHKKTIDDAADALIRSLDAAIAATKAGVVAQEVDKACRRVIEKAGFGKEFLHRTGYTFGLFFGAGSWGEKVASMKEGDRTVLEPNTTFHMIPSLNFDDFGVMMSETIRVTEDGCEVFHKDFGRTLFTK